jgi:competence protein ComEA
VAVWLAIPLPRLAPAAETPSSKAARTSRCDADPAAAHFTHNVEDSMTRLMMTLGAFVIMGILAPAPVTAQDKPAAKPAKAAAASPASPVNLNTATQAQLETLPGIGPASAKRIIEYRDKNGKFKKIEELMNVKGIGEKSFLKLKPMITVGAAPAGGPSTR